MKGFEIARPPHIVFGAGKISELGKHAATFGKTAMLISGDYHLRRTGDWERIIDILRADGIYILSVSFRDEPSPDFIDAVVIEHRDRDIDVVIAIGGGSVVDAGKAVSVMLLQDKRVKTYLEGVGSGELHNGRKLPFIAVPTTSGTGSEVTKNAVLSSVSEDGFKKSLRHDHFIPDLALIDPELMLSCPTELTASTGMDAVVQLVESFVSTQSNPMTDALAWSGLEYAAKNLVAACGEGSNNVDVRAAMAYVALMSGLCLASAGLGVVHGFASVIGGYLRIPHGEICGTLFAPAVKVSVHRLLQAEPESEALKKYARVGYLFARQNGDDVNEGCQLLIDTLYLWTEALGIPDLSKSGIDASLVEIILDETGQKNAPVLLDRDELAAILKERI